MLGSLNPVSDNGDVQHGMINGSQGSNVINARKPPEERNTAPNVLVNSHCNACDDDIDVNTHGIKCYSCKCWFHAIGCCKEEYNVSSSSAFNNHLQPAALNIGPYKGRFGNWKWFCDFCETLAEEAAAADNVDRVDLLDSKIGMIQSNFDNKFNELKELIMDKISPATVNNDITTYASIASNLTTSCKHSVENLPQVMKIEKDGTGKPVCPTELEKICVENGIAVTKTFTMKKSSASGVIVGSKKDAAKLKEKINVVFPENKVEKVLTRAPTINVSGLARKYEPENLITMIKKQNSGISELFANDSTNPEDLLLNVLAIKPQKKNENLFCATIRVSNVIRSVIGKQGMRLYIGTQATCKVHDHVYVLRCYKCQSFGHHSSNCTNTATCGYCGEEGHQTRDCQYKDNSDKKCCINCKHANLDELDHEANSVACPTFLEHHIKAKKLIPFHQTTH